MSINFERPPQPVYDIAVQSIRTGGATRPSRIVGRTELEPPLISEDFDLINPSRVFYMDVDKILAGLPLDSAHRFYNWRYFVLSNQISVATIDLSYDEARKKAEFSLLSYGTARETPQLLRDLDEQVPIKGGIFKFSMLDVPELHAHAVWLKNEQEPGTDYFKRFPNSTNDTEHTKLYEAKEFRQYLLCEAQKLDFSDDKEG